MERLKHITIIFLLAVVLPASAAEVKSPSLLLQKGLYAEQIEGDLDKAIEIYGQVLEQASESQRLAAKATYQLGMCHLKKGDEKQAVEYFQQVVSNYPTQKILAAKAQKQLEKMGVGKIAEGNLFEILGSDVCSFLGNKYGEVCAEAGMKKLYSNSHIYFVDSDFVLRTGGMGYVYNWTGKPITENYRISGMKKTNVKYYDIQDNEMDIEIIPDELRTGFYHVYWNPKEPLGTGEFFNFGWVVEGSKQLSKISGGPGCSLTMDNRFGGHCYETFFLVVPEGTILASQSEEYTKMKNFEGWDIYWWKKEVPPDTSNTVNVVLKLGEEKPLSLEAAPWADGEVMRMDLNTLAGMRIGEIIYTAETAEIENKKVWLLESYMNVLVSNVQQYTRVDASLEGFTPIFGRTKNQMGDFTADYEPDKVELAITTAGKEQKRQIELDSAVYDNEQALYLIRRMPLKEGYGTKFSIFSVQNGTTTESRVSVTGKEQITVPAGTFDCYAIELAGYAGMVKALEHKLWISADENKYLVKYDSGQAIMELKEIGLQTQAAKKIKIGEHNISLQLPSGWYHMVNPPMGMYKLMVQLVGPQMEAWVLLTVAERIPLFDSARSIAEMDIEVLKGFFKNYTVREDSWQDRTINGLDAATFEADYEDENARMVECRTYILGESMVYWFVFRIEKDKFEEKKSEFDSIVASFRCNKT